MHAKGNRVLLGYPFHLLGSGVEAKALVQVQGRQAGCAATVGPQLLPVAKSDIGADVGVLLGALGDQSRLRRDAVVVAAKDGVAPKSAVVDLDASVCWLQFTSASAGRGGIGVAGWHCLPSSRVEVTPEADWVSPLRAHRQVM